MQSAAPQQPPLVVAPCQCLTSIREEPIPDKIVATPRHGAARPREGPTKPLPKHLIIDLFESQIFKNHTGMRSPSAAQRPCRPRHSDLAVRGTASRQ